MYKQNLLAAHHIRYGRYGGVAYYHVSDQYIALYSNFISCGVHESVYLLDGIIANDSDIRANKVHGDSWAQTEALSLSFSSMDEIQFEDVYNKVLTEVMLLLDCDNESINEQLKNF